MGDDVSGSKPMVGTNEAPNVEVRSAAPAPVPKQVAAARRKMIKQLKSKDSAKKIDGVKYCLQDALFLQEPGVLTLMLGFLARVKVSTSTLVLARSKSVT